MLKRWLSVALKFAVSGLLIWFLLGTIDLVAAQARLVEVAPAYDPTGITGFLAAQVLLNFLGYVFEARASR